METVRVKKNRKLSVDEVHKYLVRFHADERLVNPDSDVIESDYFLLPKDVCSQLVGILRLVGKEGTLETRLEKANLLLKEAYSKEIESIFTAFDWESWDEEKETAPSAF